MKIEEIHQISSELIVTDDEEYCEYMRYSADHWEVRMGESWEPIFVNEAKMEKMYQEYKKAHQEV